MSMFYSARHSATSNTPSVAHRAGVGVLAATALGLGVSTMGATSASANAGPDAPAAPAPTAQTGAQSVSGSTGSTSFSGIVEKGDTGNVVKQVQKKAGVSADGVFGSQTERAVKSYQSDKGLSADGIVGSETGSKMGLSGSSSGSSGGSSSGSSASTASTSSKAASSSSGSSSSSSTSGVLGTAKSFVGTPYSYGGTSPSGFDCSGLVQHVFAQHGKDLPRTTQAQQAAATPVSNPEPGDVVFFGDSAYHNGIYAGNGKIVDAGNPGTGVTERDIWTEDVSYGRF